MKRDGKTVSLIYKLLCKYCRSYTLTRDYGIQVEFNVSEAQYLGGMEMG